MNTTNVLCAHHGDKDPTTLVDHVWLGSIKSDLVNGSSRIVLSLNSLLARGCTSGRTPNCMWNLDTTSIAS